jgi:hypothetical protein
MKTHIALLIIDVQKGLFNEAYEEERKGPWSH